MVEPVASEVKVFTDLDEMSLGVAGDVTKVIGKAVSERGRFTIALSGGRTPRLLYEQLAARFVREIRWDAVHIFWGDERYVPVDHPDSNFAMANSSLISRVPVPYENVHRIPTESESPEKAADVYEQLLRDYFKSYGGEEDTYTFDVVLLGIGEDGHTASLFPGSPALREKERWVLPVLSPPLFSPRRRITLTLPALNSARLAFIIASGVEKREIVTSILSDPVESRPRYPAAMISPCDRLVWYVDRDAFGESHGMDSTGN